MTGDAADAATIDSIKAVVTAAGGKVTVSSKPSGGPGTQIVIGTESQNPTAANIARL